MTADTAYWPEWKAGYRNGLEAGVTVAQACAADPTATAQDVVNLLETLMASSVIQPDTIGPGFHVEHRTPVVPEPWHDPEDCAAPPGQCILHP